MFKKILVAVDGSANSDRAVDAASELAKIHGSRLSICHAFHIPEHYKTDLADELEEALMGDAERILSHAVRVAEEDGVESDTKLLKKGKPGEAVLGYAEKLGADLIVVGVRGRTPDQRRAMGSVSTSIAEQATCSVLLIRPHH